MGIILDADQLNVVDVLHKYPECLNDYKRFSSLMSDCLSENIVLKRVICNAYEEGVIDSLRDSDNPQNELLFCFKRLIGNCGMREEYAKWILVVFASYWGYTDELAATGLLSKDNIYFKASEACVEFATSKISYTVRNNGIEITNIILTDCKEKTNIAIIPEFINDKPVEYIASGALNNLRKNKVSNIILPYTLKSLGERANKLYKGYEGREKKLFFYRAFVRYKDAIDEIINVSNAPGVLLFFEKKNKLSENRLLFFINDNLISNEYWLYPEDELWIYHDTLVRYTGNDRELYLNVSAVDSYALDNLEIESIKFTKRLQYIREYGICRCMKLKRIVFPERLVNLDCNAIYNCKNLIDIKWPFIDPNICEDFIYNCPALGNALIIDKTLYYMKTDDKVIVIDKDSGIERIGKSAFTDCDRARIIYIGASVIKIYDSLKQFEAVVIDNNEVEWKLPESVKKELYVYLNKDSFVFRNVSGFETRTGIYLKNIDRMSEAIKKEKPKGLSLKGDIIISIDEEKVFSLLDKDGRDDFKPDNKRYLWEKEIHERK